MITVQQLRGAGQLMRFSDDELELLLGATTPRTYAPGETLCLQGRPASSCFIVVSGALEVVKASDGRERVLTQLTTGAIAGQLALVDRAPRSATLRAVSEVTALELSRDVYERLVAASSPLAYSFQLEIAIATGRQLREANRRLSAALGARGPRATPPDATERATLERIRDSVGDLDVPFDVVEITPAERIVSHAVGPRTT